MLVRLRWDKMLVSDKETAPRKVEAPRDPDQEEKLLIENSVLDTIADSGVAPKVALRGHFWCNPALH